MPLPLFDRVRAMASPSVVVFTTGMTGAYLPFLRAGAAAVELSPPTLVKLDDNGGVLICATDATSATRAREMVQRSAGVLHVGKCYRGTVTGVKDFGAFVRINAVNEGLVPIEELDKDRVQRASDVAKEGDEMVVAVLGADDRGRLRLSRRQALGVTDAQIEF